MRDLCYVHLSALPTSKCLFILDFISYGTQSSLYELKLQLQQVPYGEVRIFDQKITFLTFYSYY